MASKVRLSAAPIDWGVSQLVDDNPSPSELLDCVKHAGYEGCELGSHAYFGSNAEEILELFRPRGLAVTASWYDVNLARPLSEPRAADIDLICSFLEAGEADILNISAKITEERLSVVSRVPQFPETWWSEEDWDQVPRTLEQIRAITSLRGVTVALHPHVASHIETGSEIRQLVRATSGTEIKLCLDTGHILLGGSDPMVLLRDEGDRIAHVHAKDVDEEIFGQLKSGAVGYVEAVGQGLYSDLGTGLVDWDALKAGLDAANYEGWVVAEQDRLLVPGSRVPFEASKRNRDFLATVFDLS